jgi:hypothetical protein
VRVPLKCPIMMRSRRRKLPVRRLSARASSPRPLNTAKRALAAVLRSSVDPTAAPDRARPPAVRFILTLLA